MPENLPISVQDTGKEFKVEAKYSPQDLGIENEKVQQEINQRVERLMGDRVREIMANPPKKWLGIRIDRDAIKEKLDQHATDMDALVKAHKEEIVKLASSSGMDLDLNLYNLGEALAKEIKDVANAKIKDAVATATQREALTPQQRQLRELGIDESYETHRTIGKKGVTGGDVLAGPQDIK